MGGRSLVDPTAGRLSTCSVRRRTATLGARWARPRSTSGSTSPAPTRRWQPSASVTLARAWRSAGSRSSSGPSSRRRAGTTRRSTSTRPRAAGCGATSPDGPPAMALLSGSRAGSPGTRCSPTGWRLVALGEGWGEDCVRAIFRAEFEADADIADPAVMAGIVSGARPGRRGGRCRAPSQPIKDALRATHRPAAARGSSALPPSWSTASFLGRRSPGGCPRLGAGERDV